MVLSLSTARFFYGVTRFNVEDSLNLDYSGERADHYFYLLPAPRPRNIHHDIAISTHTWYHVT